MTKMKSYFKKGWVIAVAAALILGSTTAMAALLNTDQANPAPTMTPTVVVGEPEPTEAAESVTPTPSPKAPVFHVIVRDADNDELRRQIKEKLSYRKDLSAEEIDKQTEQIIANMTPADEDMPAEQAAQKAAVSLTDAFALDFNGWTVRASFNKYNGAPYGDVWQLDFTKPEDQDKTDHYLATDHYSATIDAITGETLNVDFFSSKGSRDEMTTDINDPAWTDLAVNYVSGLLDQNVSIIESKITQRNDFGGVVVVCQLSDRTAYGIRMRGSKDEKQIAYAVYFPKGYDGSMDDNGGAVTEAGVG